MTFDELSRWGSLLSRNFAKSFFRLLVIYRDISASEAASRLDQHVKTAQDFLEGLYELGFVERREVYEKKRPYFRYRLKSESLTLQVNLNDLYSVSEGSAILEMKIREKKSAGAMFRASGNNPWISQVVFLTGEGRRRKERKINLTLAQGRFLFHLPFPDGEFKFVKDILTQASVEQDHIAEVLDIVQLLKSYGIIDFQK